MIAAAVSMLDVAQCMAHLGQHCPASDFTTEDLGIVIESAELSLWTRSNTPWGPLIPDSVFLRYVLPHRISQEPLVNWRPVFMEAVMPVVKDARSIEEAVILVSAWCDSLVDYRQTQFRDQSPFVTWSSGIGRCEELTVFFMCALRSVGIPCRQVYAPWWSTVDSNHAWPEVWTPGGFMYTDISAELETLNSTWFTERARSTALVVAVIPDSLPSALRYYGDVSSVNVTPVYAETGVLVCPDPAEGVTVSLVNWGSYRSLAVLDSLHNSIELGEGIYLLTWGWPVKTSEVTVIPGDTTLVELVDEGLPTHHLMNVREETL